MNKAYSWDDYIYAVNDVLLGRNKHKIIFDDTEILEICYNHCYSERDAATTVEVDRHYREKQK